MTPEKPFLFHFSNRAIENALKKGAGYPTISFRLPNWAYEKIDDLSKSTGYTKTEIAKLLIIDKLLTVENGDDENGIQH